MRRLATLLLILAVLLAAAAPSGAQQQACPQFVRSLTNFDHDAATAISTVAVSLSTRSAGAVMAIVTIESNSIRWWADGTAPTSANGHLEVAGAKFVVCGPAVGRLQMIRASADATYQASFWK